MRLIDADELLDDIGAAKENAGMGYIVARTLERYVKRMQTVDAVPVIRCRECEYKDVAGFAPFSYSYCRNVRGLSDRVRDIDFCPYGMIKAVQDEAD